MKYKKEIITITVVSFIVWLLNIVHVLETFKNYKHMLGSLSLIMIFSCSIIYVDNKIIRNYKIKKIQYQNLDLFRYLFAIIIIILHLRPFIDVSSELDLVFNNIISRICVPFFFVISGYFTAKKDVHDPNYIKKYIKSMLPLYLFWSMLYLPIFITFVIEYFPVGLTYLHFDELPIYFIIPLVILAIPLTMIITLLYSGVYYHLWYFPALFLSLYVLDKWKKRFTLKSLLIISFILLLLGATETYFGIFPLNIQNILSYYYDLFFTTRNFLFFGLFYVVFGYFIGKKKEIYSQYTFLKFSLSFVLLISEALFLQTIDRLDSNILLSSIPFVYYLFTTLLYTNPLIAYKGKVPLRTLYKYYYLIHPMVIFAFQFAILQNTRDDVREKIIEIVFIVCITHILTLLVMRIKKKFPKLHI